MKGSCGQTGGWSWSRSWPRPPGGWPAAGGFATAHASGCVSARRRSPAHDRFGHQSRGNRVNRKQKTSAVCSVRRKLQAQRERFFLVSSLFTSSSSHHHPPFLKSSPVQHHCNCKCSAVERGLSSRSADSSDYKDYDSYLYRSESYNLSQFSAAQFCIFRHF